MPKVEKASVPTISTLRTIKNLIQFVRNPIPVLNQYSDQAGKTFLLPLGLNNKAMVTSDPELIQYILQKNHRNYRKSHLQTEQLAHFIGRGLLTSNGEYWLRQRRLIQPGFHRTKLENLSEIILREIDSHLNQWDLNHIKENGLDIFQETTELTFNIVAKSLFSSDISKDILIKLSDHFNHIQSFVAKLIRQPWLKRWFLVSGQWKRHEILSKELKDIIREIIQERRESGKRYDDLLDMLLDVRYEDTGEGMTLLQLIEESLILFIAGHETSANALGWTIYLLSQHPAIVEKIRKETHSVLEEKLPTFQSLPKLVYSNAVLQEAMRLYPPAWILDRVPIEDDSFQGIALPKGRIIGLYIYGVHHNPSIWSDSEAFDPSRFDPEKIKDRHSFSYLPFGGGPRLCIGANFAMMEMTWFLIRFVQRFDFTLMENQNIQMDPLITLRPKNGVKIRLQHKMGS